MKERKTLREMADDSGWNGRCENCGHDMFWVYGTDPCGNATFRYKECRKCGRRIVTKTTSTERVIRVVKESESNEGESGGIVFRLA
jgi:transcriptional regulator NrdR family protein